MRTGAREATLSLWVTMTRVANFCDAIARNVSQTISAFLVSRFPVGSSARINAGCPQSALAIAVLCISPPLN